MRLGAPVVKENRRRVASICLESGRPPGMSRLAIVAEQDGARTSDCGPQARPAQERRRRRDRNSRWSHTTSRGSLALMRLKSGWAGLISMLCSCPRDSRLGASRTAERFDASHSSPKARPASWSAASHPGTASGSTDSIETFPGIVTSTTACVRGMRPRLACTRISRSAPA